MKKLFTSESVTEGHPDKLCDYISDSILDAFLKEDSESRVACETVAGKNIIFVTGEITSSYSLDLEKIVRNAIKEIGYTSEEIGLDYQTCQVIINLSKQSEDIALGVNNSLESKTTKIKKENGAGDQGMMFGYATDETEELMPLPITLAHKLAKRLSIVRKENILPYLRPDGKTQVTIEYEDDIPKRIDTIIVSAQHNENVSLEQIKKDITEEVINKTIPKELMDKSTKIYINPTGRFIKGGPAADSGLTGRKIIVDTYGGYAKHGGGAFSGKDATKVDRSASYMARYIAKNIVANGYAKKCEIALSYAIGIANPISISINTFNTSSISEEEILNIINKNFICTPDNIISLFKLKEPIYCKTTNYGHFGKENLPWEKIIKL